MEIIHPVDMPLKNTLTPPMGATTVMKTPVLKHSRLGSTEMGMEMAIQRALSTNTSLGFQAYASERRSSSATYQMEGSQKEFPIPQLIAMGGRPRCSVLTVASDEDEEEEEEDDIYA